MGLLGAIKSTAKKATKVVTRTAAPVTRTVKAVAKATGQSAAIKQFDVRGIVTNPRKHFSSLAATAQGDFARSLAVQQQFKSGNLRGAVFTSFKGTKFQGQSAVVGDAAQAFQLAQDGDARGAALLLDQRFAGGRFAELAADFGLFAKGGPAGAALFSPFPGGPIPGSEFLPFRGPRVNRTALLIGGGVLLGVIVLVVALR